MTLYYSLDPNAKIDDVKKACASAKEGGYSYICLPQWLVSTAAEALAGSGTGVATIIGLPGGTTKSASKYAEAKQAIVNGANLLIISVNMALCSRGDFDRAKNDLEAALVACKTANGRKSGVRSSALIDGAELDADGLRKAIGFCEAAGADPVFVAHCGNAVESLKKEFNSVEAF